MKSISVVGLGKLGSCMTAVYASKGHKVYGIDINSGYVDIINKGKAPVNEKSLDEFIKNGQENIIASVDYTKAISKSEITFIITPTPTIENGSFSVDCVINACNKIAEELSKKKIYHLIVITSTVLPGDSETIIIPELERISGKKCGVDFGFCYSPEFIAIGSVIHDLLNPDFFLIGEFDKKSGDILSEFYATVNDVNAPVRRMNIPSAELTKISLNAYITTKITYANMLAEICENIPGADVDKVTEALGSDERIGRKYIKSGLGFGGPCFPRDNKAFSYMAEKFNSLAPIAKVVHNYNENMAERIANKVLKNISEGDKIGVFGLSYKPGTSVVEESHALKITKKIIDSGANVSVYDPSGYEHAKKELRDDVIYFDNIKDCSDNCDTYFIGTPDKKFIDFFENNKNIINKIIIDPWKILEDKGLDSSNKYITFGKG